jgi:hypothetical protein
MGLQNNSFDLGQNTTFALLVLSSEFFTNTLPKELLHLVRLYLWKTSSLFQVSLKTQRNAFHVVAPNIIQLPNVNTKLWHTLDDSVAVIVLVFLEDFLDRDSPYFSLRLVSWLAGSMWLYSSHLQVFIVTPSSEVPDDILLNQMIELGYFEKDTYPDYSAAEALASYISHTIAENPNAEVRHGTLADLLSRDWSKVMQRSVEPRLVAI